MSKFPDKLHVRVPDPRCTCDNEQGCDLHDPVDCAGVGEDGRCGVHKPGTPGCVNNPTPPSTRTALDAFFGRRGPPGPEARIRVTIDYTNYKGVRRKRVVIPLEIEFRETPDHKPAQWILQAYDVEKGARRSFAMKDVHSWEVAP